MTKHMTLEEFDVWRKERGLAMNDEERACKTKKTYSTQKNAKKAGKHSPNGRYKVYRCPYCQGFHVAKKKKRKTDD